MTSLSRCYKRTLGLGELLSKENQTCLQFIPMRSLFLRIIKIRKELILLGVTLHFYRMNPLITPKKVYELTYFYLWVNQTAPKTKETTAFGFKFFICLGQVSMPQTIVVLINLKQWKNNSKSNKNLFWLTTLLKLGFCYYFIYVYIFKILLKFHFIFTVQQKQFTIH